MTEDARPVVVAYDASDEAKDAVRQAATLFPGRPLVVLSVWEPGMAAMAALPGIDSAGMTVPPDPVEAAAIDRAQRDHAKDLSEAGADLARGLGATAEPLSVPDEADVAETIAAVADERDACAIVVGSRGLGRIKARLLGSTSQGLLHTTQRPVLVVRAGS